MKETRGFDAMTDRYAFDTGPCSPRLGFAQVDTGQDASYFGTWANPNTLKIVSYIEGDILVQEAESPEEFVSEIQRIRDWNEENGYGFKGIDPMCVPEIEEGFKALGLGDLLH